MDQKEFINFLKQQLEVKDKQLETMGHIIDLLLDTLKTEQELSFTVLKRVLNYTE